ncbi:peptidoglycan-binding domain-containing protein [Thalassococcus sp. S3]|uniref:peptidoglycan-binding domain-containing protein n=1 Tax=Thalassococcus sp. S3 TaxID=2017482 RepID=UPI0010243E6D|nr:peptidoglycan-binding domain-containing protein [Thalassococcus sp. S3]QBF32737.1 peptidoglycan-binding protein [Thalassococcus sp. S3]
MLRTPFAIVLVGLGLTGCAGTTDTDDPSLTAYRSVSAPPGAAPGTCWGKTTQPAIIETITEQIVVEAEKRDDDGTLLRPARYRTETRQLIVRERSETWFETPCADALTPEFLSSLQRALAARGKYSGEISGTLDARTRTAIRGYQREDGIDSPVLSLATARKLGLVVAEPID